MTKHSIITSIGILGLVLAVGPLAASPAAAGRRRAQRIDVDKDKQGEPKEGTPAPAAEPAQSEPERKAPAQFGWTVRPPADKSDMEARAIEKTDEVIEKIKELLPTLSEEEKPDLYFRLAERYWSKSKYLSLRAMQKWDEALEAWSAAGSQGEQPKLEKMPEYDEAEVYKREALKIYEKILASYPKYERNDEVLYNLGTSLYESGEKVRGIEMYWTLLKQHPESTFSGDAWLSLGEHFFNANKLAQAVKAYTEAAKTDANGVPQNPRIYSYALYKLAWCDINLQEYERALARFQSVIAYAKAPKASQGQDQVGDISERDRIQLVAEALADLVKTYSFLDTIDDAFEYYTTQVGRDEAYKYLRKLGQTYDSQGKYALEIKTFEELNRRYATAPEAPINQMAIVNAYAQLNKNDFVRKEIRRLIDLYSPNSLWAQSNAGNQKVLDAAFDVVEQQLAALVTEQHRAAQQTKLVETYKLARDIYQEYLEKFTSSPNTYRFRFFYAEILFELKDFEAAAREYSRVVEADPKGEFVKPAAYTAILAWEKVASGVKEELGKRIDESKRGKNKGSLKQLEKIEELERGKSYDPLPLAPVEQKLADACDRFVEVAPDDPEVAKVKFKSARIYFVKNHFSEAIGRFGEVVNRWPKDALAPIAADSILQSLAVRESWSELNRWARELRNNKQLTADREFAKKVGEFVEGASFNEIHYVYEPKGEALATADRYADFVREFPKSKFALVALYNAIVNYDKANLLEKSISYSEKVVQDYADFSVSADDLKDQGGRGVTLPTPDSIREKVLFMLASFNERLADFDRAADLYERYVKEYPTGERRADAFFNAGLFREGLGDLDRAITNFGAYVREFPGKEDVPQIAWRIGLIYERKKALDEASRHFMSYAKSYPSDGAMVLCAEYKAIKARMAQDKLRREAREKSKERPSPAEAQRERERERDREKELRTGLESVVSRYAALSDADKAKACPLEAVAGSAFTLIEPEYEAYVSIVLEGSEKELENRLVRKLQLIKTLTDRYAQVLAYGHGDYGIAALYRIGALYQQLARQLSEQKCPRGLTEDQCEMYKAMAQDKAFPLEERAIEAFEKTLEKAYELGLYNEWLAKAQEALAVYEPGRFPEVPENPLVASESVSEVPKLVEESR